MSAHVAVREDTASGATEEVRYLGPAGGRIFCYLHLPKSPAAFGLVVCSPILSDFVANYRREVALARDLAKNGVAVLRFHYRGSGNSDGTALELTAETAVSDAVVAIHYLTERLRDAPVGLLGTRIGSIIAASAATRCELRSPLVLIEPQEADTYLREGLRAAAMRELKERKDGAARRSPEETWDSGEPVDLLGYPLTRELHQSLSQVQLSSLLLDLGTTPMLLVALNRTRTAGGRVAELAGVLSQAGRSVELIAARSDESWWFQPDDGEDASSDDALARVVTWLCSRDGNGEDPT